MLRGVRMKPDREKVLRFLQDWYDCEYLGRINHGEIIEPEREKLLKQAIALLKEQEEQERKWLRNIADNQIANAPNDSPMSLDEQLECEYKRGIWDGLQMAFEILTEGR